MFSDEGYQGAAKREETQNIDVDWHVVMRPGKRRVQDRSSPMAAIMDKLERTRASIRAKVDHPFRVSTPQFGHVRVRYLDLTKNTAQLIGKVD